MKIADKIFILLAAVSLMAACNEKPDNIRGIPTVPAVKAEVENVEALSEELKINGYQTFAYEEGDSIYLMQQYYLVLLKQGMNRNQDSIEAARLQEQHLAHLDRMYKGGYSSLAGPIGDDGEIRGVVVYNTATLKEADSLANLDPMVQAGRLEIEIHPWWALKGGKLN